MVLRDRVEINAGTGSLSIIRQDVLLTSVKLNHNIVCYPAEITGVAQNVNKGNNNSSLR